MGVEHETQATSTAKPAIRRAMPAVGPSSGTTSRGGATCGVVWVLEFEGNGCLDARGEAPERQLRRAGDTPWTRPGMAEKPVEDAQCLHRTQRVEGLLMTLALRLEGCRSVPQISDVAPDEYHTTRLFTGSTAHADHPNQQ